MRLPTESSFVDSCRSDQWSLANPVRPARGRGSPSRAADRRARAAQGQTRWSKDDQAVRRSAPHIGVAEAGRHPQSVGSPLRRGTISVSASKQGALGADHHIKKEVQMTKAKDAAALRVAPLDT